MSENKIPDDPTGAEVEEPAVIERGMEVAIFDTLTRSTAEFSATAQWAGIEYNEKDKFMNKNKNTKPLNMVALFCMSEIFTTIRRSKHKDYHDMTLQEAISYIGYLFLHYVNPKELNQENGFVSAMLLTAMNRLFGEYLYSSHGKFDYIRKEFDYYMAKMAGKDEIVKRYENAVNTKRERIRLLEANTRLDYNTVDKDNTIESNKVKHQLVMKAFAALPAEMAKLRRAEDVMSAVAKKLPPLNDETKFVRNLEMWAKGISNGQAWCIYVDRGGYIDTNKPLPMMQKADKRFNLFMNCTDFDLAYVSFETLMKTDNHDLWFDTYYSNNESPKDMRPRLHTFMYGLSNQKPAAQGAKYKKGLDLPVAHSLSILQLVHKKYDTRMTEDELAFETIQAMSHMEPEDGELWYSAGILSAVSIVEMALERNVDPKLFKTILRHTVHELKSDQVDNESMLRPYYIQLLLLQNMNTLPFMTGTLVASDFLKKRINIALPLSEVLTTSTMRMLGEDDLDKKKRRVFEEKVMHDNSLVLLETRYKKLTALYALMRGSPDKKDNDQQIVLLNPERFIDEHKAKYTVHQAKDMKDVDRDKRYTKLMDLFMYLNGAKYLRADNAQQVPSYKQMEDDINNNLDPEAFALDIVSVRKQLTAANKRIEELSQKGTQKTDTKMVATLKEKLMAADKRIEELSQKTDANTVATLESKLMAANREIERLKPEKAAKNELRVLLDESEAQVRTLEARNFELNEELALSAKRTKASADAEGQKQELDKKLLAATERIIELERIKLSDMQTLKKMGDLANMRNEYVRKLEEDKAEAQRQIEELRAETHKLTDQIAGKGGDLDFKLLSAHKQLVDKRLEAMVKAFSAENINVRGLEKRLVEVTADLEKKLAEVTAERDHEMDVRKEFQEKFTKLNKQIHESNGEELRKRAAELAEQTAKLKEQQINNVNAAQEIKRLTAEVDKLKGKKKPGEVKRDEDDEDLPAASDKKVKALQALNNKLRDEMKEMTEEFNSMKLEKEDAEARVEELEGKGAPKSGEEYIPDTARERFGVTVSVYRDNNNSNNARMVRAVVTDTNMLHEGIRTHGIKDFVKTLFDVAKYFEGVVGNGAGDKIMKLSFSAPQLAVYPDLADDEVEFQRNPKREKMPINWTKRAYFHH